MSNITIITVASFDLASIDSYECVSNIFLSVASFDLASFDIDVCDMRHNFYPVASFYLASFCSYDCVSNIFFILLPVLISHHPTFMFVA